MQRQSCFCVVESLPALCDAWRACRWLSIIRLTKFQGPDLLAHLKWFSCTCRNLSKVLVGGALDAVVVKSAKAKASCVSESLELHPKWRWEAFVFLGQRPKCIEAVSSVCQASICCSSWVYWSSAGEDSSLAGCLGQPDPVPLCVPGRLHLDCDPDFVLCPQNGLLMVEAVKEGTVQSEHLMEKSL